MRVLQGGYVAKRDRHVMVSDDMLQTFSELEFSVYNAILHNLGSFADMRVADIARIAGVSNASVVRFCKKCGYAGFPALKAAVLSQLEEELPVQRLAPVLDDMNELATPEVVAGLTDSINRAFELIRWSDVLLILGSERSSGLALYGAHLFSSMGVPTVPITSFPTYAVPLAGRDVTAIVLSHGGVNLMVCAALQDLVSAGSHAIVITSNAESPLARLADVCISYRASRDRALNAAGLVTRIPALYVLEQLGRLLYNDRLDALPTEQKQH